MCSEAELGNSLLGGASQDDYPVPVGRLAPGATPQQVWQSASGTMVYSECRAYSR